MTFSQRRSRPYQLSMAVVCTLLASGGFVAAGYVGTSSADAAAAASIQETIQATPATANSNDAAPVGFGSFAAQGLGVKLSFADTLIQAKKPAAKKIFDLTDPNGNTPHLAQGVNAMRGGVPEISAELISQVRKDILTAAYQGLGHPYVWGGTSFANGWDCSGFVQWAYAQAGVALPRTEQWLPMVQTNNPQPGDIVVQNPDGPNHWSHIGIYIGNGRMISALNPSVGTFIHAPGDVSSSSSYFTMPAFASDDEKARADAAKVKAEADNGQNTPEPSESTAPEADPSTEPGAQPATTKPGTTAPGTTAPTKPAATKPGTTAPTKPAPTKPAPTKPAPTEPGTTAPTTAPTTTPPATTPPAATTPPPTTAPAATTPPATTTTPAAVTPTAAETTTTPAKSSPSGVVPESPATTSADSGSSLTAVPQPSLIGAPTP